MLLYNFPQNTGIDLAAEAVAELSHHPNIIGIKESSGNVEKLMQMVRETKKGFQVLTGSATTLAPSLAIGCIGGILAFANPAPYATISIWEAHRTREARSRAGLAESHRPRSQAGDHEVRHRRAEIRDGSDRILWRSAAPAADGAYARGKAGDRRSVRGLAGLR